MAATYGYGGEFSSDEDIDRMEQQSERLTQSKFDAYAHMKPTKNQIEEAIELIKNMPADQDITATDELLAGLLDYYKVQRGPIVNSTRNLYKNIVIKLVRDQQSSNGNDPSKETNGQNANPIKKNQEIDVTPSSDEDEPMPPVSSQSSVEQNKRRFDSRVVYKDKLEPMEVDSEAPARQAIAGIRNTKPVDMSTSEDSETEESSDESSDDSEVIDVTPIKPNANQALAPEKASSTPLASVVKPAELVSKNKVTTVDPKKKPYTRSQRVAATKATSSAAKKTDVGSGKSEASPVPQAAVKPLTKSAQSSKFKVRYLVSALLVVVLALFLYYFKSDLNKTTDRLLSRAIKF